MVVLSHSSLVRNGHFPWCPVAQATLVHRECQRCQAQVYFLALIVSMLTAVLEFWGSAHTGSVSLLSDAWHVVSDGFGYLVGGAYAILVWRRIGNRRLHQQAKELGEFLLGSLLFLAGVNILADVGERLWWHNLPVIKQTGQLLVVATVGLAANIALLSLFQAFRLGHRHDAASHCHEEPQERNRMLTANFWHTLGDAASSALVILNAIIFSCTDDPAWRYLDLVASAAIASLLVWQGLEVLSGDEKTNGSP